MPNDSVIPQDDDRYLTVARVESDSKSPSDSALYKRRLRAEQQARARRAGLIDDFFDGETIGDNPLIMGILEIGVAEFQSSDLRKTSAQVADFFGIRATGALAKILEANRQELMSHGYDDYDKCYSPRAIVCVALLLRPHTSERASKIQEFLDPAPMRLAFAPGPRNRKQMGSVLETVSRLIEAAANEHQEDVWAEIRDLDDYTLRAAMVALLHGASAEGGRLAKIKKLDPDVATHPAGGSAAGGLATVVPTKESWRGAALSEVYVIDDAAVGL
jgi:hypothetical protein